MRVRLKRAQDNHVTGESLVFKNDSGKLTVYASADSSPKQRLKSVRTAAEKMAKQLDMDFEMVKQSQGASPIYVYYEDSNEEPIPIYCDEGKNGDLSEISGKIRNMMFVLSFHPRHAALRHFRKTLFALS